jgi:hypothetical protein
VTKKQLKKKVKGLKDDICGLDARYEVLESQLRQTMSALGAASRAASAASAVGPSPHRPDQRPEPIFDSKGRFCRRRWRWYL